MKYFWIILFLAASPVLLAVEADLRPSQPMAGEVFQLLLTGSDQYPAPEKLPEVKGIQWLTNSTSRSYRNINGQASYTLGIAAIAASLPTIRRSCPKIRHGLCPKSTSGSNRRLSGGK